ncbi:MAG: sugar transferase [Firmicutes bacterium]|nr:sugar transferase [Bacillota bacterium]
MYKHFLKRIFDFLISLTAIIFLLPFFIIFTPIVAIAMHGNPFFIQYRPGKKGKIFKLIKYRSMTNKKDKDGNLLPDEVRLTKFGKFLRKTSLDELPELFNILVGDMAIIGPRPLLVKYLDLYSSEQAHRHDVRPGLTGWAQVNGRNDTTWEKRFAYDLEYVKKCSFFLDVKIFFMTIGKVFKRSGISQNGEATMEEFRGNNVQTEEKTK